MSKTVTIQQLAADRSGTLTDIAAYLAQSGRVFRGTEGGIVFVSKTGFTLAKPNQIGATILLHGLVKLVNDGRALDPGRNESTYVGILNNLVDLPDAVALLPNVASVVRGPAFRLSQDELRLEPRSAGYDAVDHIVTVVESMPTLPMPDPGFPHLHKLFSGLIFADPIYQANLYGFLLASFARTALTDFPFLMLDAEEKSSGKTKTAMALGYLLMGKDVSPAGFGGGEAEVETRLGAYCEQPGPNAIIIDNVRPKRGMTKQIRSSTFKILTNSRCPAIRTLYKTGAPLCDPIVIITMNGARVESDLADSMVRVSLWRPVGGNIHRMLDPNPAVYAAKHRLAILAEVLSILGSIVMEPVDGAKMGTRFYHFERIAVAAAAKMGLAANYHADVVQNSDALVHELYYLMKDEFSGTAPVTTVMLKITTSSRVTELRDMLVAEARENKGAACELQRWIETTLKGRQFKFPTETVRFIVREDPHLNQAVIVVEPVVK